MFVSSGDCRSVLCLLQTACGPLWQEVEKEELSCLTVVLQSLSAGERETAHAGSPGKAHSLMSAPPSKKAHRTSHREEIEESIPESTLRADVYIHCGVVETRSVVQSHFCLGSFLLSGMPPQKGLFEFWKYKGKALDCFPSQFH